MSAINPFRETIKALSKLQAFDPNATTNPDPLVKKIVLRREWVDGQVSLKAVPNTEIGCGETFLSHFNASPVNLKWVVDLLNDESFRVDIRKNLGDNEWDEANNAVEILNDRIDRYNARGFRSPDSYFYDKSLTLEHIRKFPVPNDVATRKLNALSTPAAGATSTAAKTVLVGAANVGSSAFAFGQTSSMASATVAAATDSVASGVSASAPVTVVKPTALSAYATMDPSLAKDKLAADITELTKAYRDMNVLVDRQVAVYRKRFADITTAMNDAFKTNVPADLKASYEILRDLVSATDIMLTSTDYTFSYIFDKVSRQIRQKSLDTKLWHNFTVAIDVHGGAAKLAKAAGAKAAAAQSYTKEELRTQVAAFFEQNQKSDVKLRALLVAAMLDQNRALGRAVVENYSALNTLYATLKKTLGDAKKTKDPQHAGELEKTMTEKFNPMKAKLGSSRSEAELIATVGTIRTSLVARVEKQLERAIKSHGTEQSTKADAVKMKEELSALQSAQKTKKKLGTDEYLEKLYAFEARLKTLVEKSSEGKPTEAFEKMVSFAKAMKLFETNLAVVRDAKLDTSNLDAALAEYIKREHAFKNWPTLAHVHAFSKLFSMNVTLAQKVGPSSKADAQVVAHLPKADKPQAVLALDFVDHTDFEIHVDSADESDDDLEVEGADGDDDIDPSLTAGVPPLSVAVSSPSAASINTPTPASTLASLDIRGLPVMHAPNTPVPTPLGLAAMPLQSPMPLAAATSSVKQALSNAPTYAQVLSAAEGATANVAGIQPVAIVEPKSGVKPVIGAAAPTK